LGDDAKQAKECAEIQRDVADVEVIEELVGGQVNPTAEQAEGDCA
jgi:hypothetical protein